MSGGADIEADVGLEVDGGPVFRAFDQIVARMGEIQSQVELITSKAKAAAEAFGGTSLETLNNFNKVVSTLERFQSNLNKANPLGRQYDLALAAQAKQNKPADQAAAQQAAAWSKIDRARYTEQSKLNDQLEREQIQREQEVARINEQNRLKVLRDQSQLQVQQANGIKELEALQLQSSARIGELRRVRDTGNPEQERSALQLLAIEKQQLAAVEARIAAEQKAAVSTVANRVNSQMDSRAAKLEETAGLASANLGEARVRQAELEATIAANIEKANAATAEERAQVEKLLTLDKARLVVADQRVAALEKEAAAAVRAAQPKPGTYGPPLPPGIKPPSSSGGDGGLFPNLLGHNGIAGVFAFSAAYGAAASVIYGVVSTIKTGIEEAIKFSDTLDKIGAIAGATDTQMGELATTIESVAENSKIARSEIADTAEALAQAGYSVLEIQQALGALVKLSEATGADLKEVTDVVTGAIGAFQLSAQDTTRVANEMAAALNGTRLTIQEMGTGIQSVGEIANEQNQSFEDLTANLSAMSEAGLRGQQLGMGYRQVLMQLATPSKTLVQELKRLGLTFDDINVKTLGMTGVINNLTNAGFTSGDAFKVFGARASAAFLAIRDQQGTALKVALELSQHKAAAEDAAKSMDSLSAQWQRFKNTANDGTTNGLEPATTALAHFFKMINDEADDGALAKLQDNLQKALMASDGKSTEQVEAARAALRDYQQQKEQVTAAEEAHAKASEEVETALNKATEAAAKEQQTLGEIDQALVSVSVRKQILTRDSGALAAETLNLEQQFSGLAAMLQNVALNYDNLTKAMINYRQNQLSIVSLQESVGMNAAQSAVGNFAGEGRDYLHMIHQQSWFSKLPASVQQAIQGVQTSRSADGSISAMVRSQGITVIQNYMDSGKAPNGANNLLGHYIAAAGNLGLSISQYDTHRLNRDTANALAQPDMAAIAANITQTSDRGSLNQIRTTLNARLKNSRGANAQAIVELLKMVDSKASLSEPPSPKPTAAKKNNIGARQDAAFDAESLKVDEMALKNAVKNLAALGGNVGGDNQIVIARNRTMSDAQMQTNLKAVSDDLDRWISDRRMQFADELKRLKIDPNSARGREMQTLLDDEIKQKREQLAQQVTAEILKVMQRTVDAVNEVAKAAAEAVSHQANMAQARVTALGRQSYINGGAGVPDYIQQTYERAAARSKDQADAAMIGVNQNKINGLQGSFDQTQRFLDFADFFGLNSDAQDQQVQKTLTGLHDQIVELTHANEELKASFQAGLIPESFNQKLQMAIENYKQVNHLTASWSDIIAGDLTNALSTGQNALQQFFQDILTGNATVAQSFANLAKAVIGYIGQMIAKMLAMKLMETILNIFGGGLNAGQATADASMSAAHTSTVLSGLGFTPKFHGGVIHALTGRYITDGVSYKDSVPAMIAKGEYVVRKTAVDSVGVDFMDRLNSRGASALGALSPKVIMPPPAHQQMSVYVVPPDQKPTMGPNDVLLTIADDIWRGGQTKQLIKQVAQGA